jgi:uncharacterized protein YodC (DUF2158 family)
MVVGDTVRLKSGGPVMTVSNIREGVIVCSYFDKTTKKVDRFVEATLVTVEA